MNQIRPQMQMGMQQQAHPAYAMQHPQMAAQPQPQQQVQYDPSRNVNGLYHPSITSPQPPPSPYDPISPGPALSDHSASGTESGGGGGGMPHRAAVPIMPSRVYRHHSHSHSSASSTSSGEHPYAPPSAPYHPHGHHRKNRSIDRVSVTPPPQFQGSDDEEGDFGRMDSIDPYTNQISLLNRKESTRRQRIQAEQRRRDELRDGYARLKDVLPISNSKSSKVSLIERARSHIIDIASQNTEYQREIESLKADIARLQQLSDQMAMTVSLPMGAKSADNPDATAQTVDNGKKEEDEVLSAATPVAH
jgi:hypothetical protein